MKKWEELQEEVVRALTIVDRCARETAGSGAVKGNGDVVSPSFMVECKQRARRNIVIEQGHWDKIKEEAALLERIPAIVAQNESEETIISMELSDFVSFVLHKEKDVLHKCGLQYRVVPEI